MRSVARGAATLLLALLAACDSPTGDGGRLPRALAIPLDIPSDDETVFAETRDFTVVGYFTTPLTRPGNVRIELFAGESATGPALRTIQSAVDPATGVTPRTSLDFAYARGQAWGPDGPVTDPARMVMSPDLVASPGGIEDPTNKLVVTSEYYAGVILGGVSRTFDTSYGNRGVAWTDLTAGTYTIRVTGLSGQLMGLRATRRIEFGRTHAMLGRFSPGDHRTALLDFAAANAYRTYIDFFPGFFSHGGYSYEIPGRWMANNSVEVVNTSPAALTDHPAAARNDVLLYNISATSATNRIEIGAIVAHDLLDTRTAFHYYDIGEPSLAWRDAGTGQQRTLAGSIEPFDTGDRLVTTRVEIRIADDVDHDGGYDVGSSVPVSVDTNLDDGVIIGAGDEFSVHGVVTPIPAGVRPGALAHQYEMDNAIDSIRYEIRNAEGGVVQAWTRATGLHRRYDPAAAPGTISTSVYEFGHELRLEAPAGSYVLSLVGLDRRGQQVVGTGEVFTITLIGGGVAGAARLP